MNDDYIILKIPTEKGKQKRKIIAFATIPIIIFLIAIVSNLLYFANIKNNNLVRTYSFDDNKIEFEIIGINKTLEVRSRIINDNIISTNCKYIDFDFALENGLIKRGDLMQRFMSFTLQSKFFDIDERAVYTYLLNEELSKKSDSETENAPFPEADITIRFEDEEESSPNTSTETENDIENISSEIFVTLSGECYHLSECRFLGKSKIPIELDEAKEKYRDCSLCRPPQ